MLKHMLMMPIKLLNLPAAFGRLCVETFVLKQSANLQYQPPSGGCVLKRYSNLAASSSYCPAAFGRLCVETWLKLPCRSGRQQPAAFGRLCVETMLHLPDARKIAASRLRAAVC